MCVCVFEYTVSWISLLVISFGHVNTALAGFCISDRNQQKNVKSDEIYHQNDDDLNPTYGTMNKVLRDAHMFRLKMRQNTAPVANQEELF